MSVINFSIPSALLKKIEKLMREKGFASKAEFFRHCAHMYIDRVSIDMTEDIPSDELIEAIQIAEHERKNGSLKKYEDIDSLFRALDKRL